MIETKICTNQSCGNEFSRQPGMSFAAWDQIKCCHKCRRYKRRSRPVESRHPESVLGRYDFPKCLDVFLYQTKPTEATP